ncbi:hypothetical protein, partial [Brucella melitensis]|uniref:hypothetical protein n=1 Tax=Brucella melitensis TaxID=29459 RepID=UPI0022640F18
FSVGLNIFLFNWVKTIFCVGFLKILFLLNFFGFGGVFGVFHLVLGLVIGRLHWILAVAQWGMRADHDNDN